MIPLYEKRIERLSIFHKVSRHVSPHLHSAMEIVYVTDGNLELGVGQELFHMEKGDFAIVFPDVIHHYQVFCPGGSKAYYLLASSALGGQFLEDMRKYCPADPVIKSSNLHPDIPNAVRSLYRNKDNPSVVEQAYTQIILARSMSCFELVEKSSIGGNDIIYQTVSYVAGHFKEEISLDTMAKNLGVSKYVLSRVFSGTFHRNFNQYLNEQRLDYVCTLLECTNRSITDICMEAGFESQRTFNRAFREKYRMTPREYRNKSKENILSVQQCHS